MNTRLRTRQRNNNGFGVIELLLILLVAVVLAGAGWYVWMRERGTHSNGSTGTTQDGGGNPNPAPTPSPAPDPYAGWKTYSSTQEKATFRYPTDWTVDAAAQYASNDSANTDYIALKSPDGKVVVHWTSMITGFGNEHGSSYPLHEVVDKTAIVGASGDHVVSGVSTLDGTTYYPWIAVENDSNYGILSSGVQGTLDLFVGRNNINKSTGRHDTALFSTSGPQTNQGAPGLGKAEAEAYLGNANMQQAKLILLSLTY